MPRRVPTKQKQSFTLSRTSVRFLKRLRKERRSRSTSQVLDELVQEAEASRTRMMVDAQIEAYYSGLSAVERKERMLWGDWALAQLPKEGD